MIIQEGVSNMDMPAPFTSKPFPEDIKEIFSKIKKASRRFRYYQGLTKHAMRPRQDMIDKEDKKIILLAQIGLDDPDLRINKIAIQMLERIGRQGSEEAIRVMTETYRKNRRSDANAKLAEALMAPLIRCGVSPDEFSLSQG